MRSEKYNNEFDMDRFNELLMYDGTVRPEKEVQKKEAPKKNSKQTTNKVHWYTKLLLFIDICAILCFFFAYGPIGIFRNWVVTTALQTQTHKYFAYILYNDNMVDKVKLANSYSQSEKGTDTSLINFTDHDPSEGYSSIYEQQVLERDAGQDYKIIEINEDAYNGFLTVVYDPTKLHLAVAEKSNGDTILSMAKRLNAKICVNGGGFTRDWETLVIHPSIVIKDGYLLSDNGERENIIGMTKDGILCLMSEATADEAMAQNLDWGVVFSPFLIVNGVPTTFKGNGGYGVQPRTAIGQRSDGIVLILTIDGRGANNSKGITVVGLQEIFLRYGCVNATNLDGGGSTTLVENGVILNSPMGGGSTSGERHVYDAIYLE